MKEIELSSKESFEHRPEAVEYGRCPVCGYLMLPVLPFSPCGHNAEPERLLLQTPGEVYSWTRVWVSADEPGNTMVMADFFGGDLRVTAPLVGSDEIAIGDPVYAAEGSETPVGLYAGERSAGHEE